MERQVRSKIRQSILGDNTTAIADADAAVAIISSASQYIKDVVWEYVHEESITGRWAKTHFCYLCPTDSTNCKKDLKGNGADIVLGGAGGYFEANVGYRLIAGAYLTVDINPSEFKEDIGSYNYNFMFPAISKTGGGSQYFVYNVKDGFNSIDKIYTSVANYQLQFNHTWQGQTMGSSASDLQGFFSVGCQADEIFIKKDDGSYDTFSRSSAPSVIPDAVMNINSDETGSLSGHSMDVSFVSMTDADIDHAGLKANTKAAITALERTYEPFTNVLVEGDSTSISTGVVFLGYADYVTAPITMFREDVSARTLAEVEADLAAHLVTHSPDSILMKAGVNDIAIDGTSEAAMKIIVDDIFTAIEADGGVEHIYWLPITQFKENPSMNWTEAKQTIVDNINAYIVTKCAAYSQTAKCGIDIVDQVQSTVRTDSLSMTDTSFVDNFPAVPRPDDWELEENDNYSVDGVHYPEGGAKLIASTADGYVNSLRYIRR